MTETALSERLKSYYKMNMVPAAKTVWHDLRVHKIFSSSLYLLLVLLVLQVMLGTIWCAHDSNQRLTDQAIREKYDYYIVFRSISPTIANALSNNEDLFSMRGTGTYRVIRREEVPNGTDTPYFDVYVTLGQHPGGGEKNLYVIYWSFLQNFFYLAESSTPYATIETTPLFYADASYSLRTLLFGIMELQQTGVKKVNSMFNIDVPYLRKPFLCIPWDHLADTGDTIALCAILVVLGISFLVLLRLFAVQLNQRKHTYGIYMTFGADSRKLFALSAWENIYLSLLALLPSFGISTVLNLLLLRRSPIGYRFHPSMLPTVLLLSLLISLLALRISASSVTKRQVIDLLIAENNANMVSSPRQSLDFTRMKFPIRYSVYNYWRFRKYYIPLVLFTALFTAFFVCGQYLTTEYARVLRKSQPSYTISLHGGTDWYDYNYMVKEKLEEIEGISRAYSRVSTSAAGIASHTEFPAGSIAGGVDFVRSSDGALAVNNLFYVMGDQNTAGQLLDAGFGESSTEFLQDPAAVTVAVTKNGSALLHLKPGDTLRVAGYAGRNSTIDTSDTARRMLEQELLSYQYTYWDLTVSAVIEEESNEDGIFLYLHHDVYRALTGSASPALYGSYLLLNPDAIHEDFIPDVSDHFRHYIESTEFSLPESEIVYAKTDDLRYYSTDDYTLFAFEQRAQDDDAEGSPQLQIAGDIQSVLTDRNAVIVSRSIGENTALDLKVGESILVAVPAGRGSFDGANIVASYRIEDRLVQDYQLCSFRIAAFVDDPDATHAGIYFSPAAYEMITGNAQQYNFVEVYSDDGLSIADAERQYSAIRTWSYLYTGEADVTRTGALTAQSQAENFNYLGYASLLSSLFPLIVFPCLLFTQLLFYVKRQEEMRILRVFGALRQSINRLYWSEAALLTILCLVIYPIFVFAGLIPLFNLTKNLGESLAGFHFPTVAFLLGILITAIQCGLSVLIPKHANEQNENLNFN